MWTFYCGFTYSIYYVLSGEKLKSNYKRSELLKVVYYVMKSFPRILLKPNAFKDYFIHFISISF